MPWCSVSQMQPHISWTQALAEVVVSVLGGAFDSEDTLQQIWQAESAKQKEKNGWVQVQ